MGWTSYSYRNESHMSFNKEAAASFINNEYAKDGYSIDNFHFHKAESLHDHHEVYLRMTHPTGKKFVMVVIIDIVDGEIYFKEIEESMGPVYYHCPLFIYSTVKAPNEYALKWRKECSNRMGSESTGTLTNKEN